MDFRKKKIILFPFNLLYRISPRLTLRILFRFKQGYSLHLRNPKTYNEKLQWIKLNDHNPLMPLCSDKLAVRQFVKEKGWGHILNELYWSGINPTEIPFESLPKQFVMKTTHGSSFNIIVKNKNVLDQNRAIKQLGKWLKTKYIPCYGEWYYNQIKPHIVVEKYLEELDGQLRDYKVFCFNGEPVYIRVYSDRSSYPKSDLYTTDWTYIHDDYKRYPPSGKIIPKPECLEEMLSCAKQLSKPFLHVRVDFYIVEGKLIFGEMTFTSGAGFNRFSSYEFDLKLGQYLIIGG